MGAKPLGILFDPEGATPVHGHFALTFKTAALGLGRSSSFLGRPRLRLGYGGCGFLHTVCSRASMTLSKAPLAAQSQEACFCFYECG